MAGTERFTTRARRVLSFAHQEAERAHHTVIEPEHLLLGLMHEEGGMAGRVLRELGVTEKRMRDIFHRIAKASPNFDPNRVELGIQTQQVLENAVNEARRMGHDYIGTEHILLGVVPVDSAAMEILRWLGITPEQIRRQTQRVLDESAAFRNNQIPSSFPAKKTSQVLLISGQDTAASQAVASYIESLGLQVIRFNQNSDDHQYDIFAAEVHFAVALLTADDLVVSQSESQTTKFHASQNVIYGLGFFRGKLGYKRVCALFKSDLETNVELPTESFRVVYIPLDSIGTWRLTLSRQMQEAGIMINSGNIE